MSQIKQVSGTAIPVRGNDIDTDRIIPARYLKEVTFDRMGEYPFFDERFDARGALKPHPFNDPKFQGASVLLVNANFGCGSSREHAPQALYRWGIRAIVGESFAAIFAGNALAIGLPTVTLPAPDVERLMDTVEQQPRLRFTVDLVERTLRAGAEALSLAIPDTVRIALLEGYWDSTGMLAANMAKVREVAMRLPYLTGFPSS